MSQIPDEALRLVVNPRADIIQVSADGLGTYYHVKVNNFAAGELFMSVTEDLQWAEVWLKINRSEVGRIRFWTDHAAWLQDAHSKVAGLLREQWPCAEVYYYTGAGFGPVSERRSLGGSCADRQCCSEGPREQQATAG